MKLDAMRRECEGAEYLARLTVENDAVERARFEGSVLGLVGTESSIPGDLCFLGSRLLEMPVVKGPVIYSLLKDGRIVYVGQSTRFGARIEEHRESGKIFDRVLFVEAFADTLNELEMVFIRRLAPELNLVGADSTKHTNRISCPS